MPFILTGRSMLGNSLGRAFIEDTIHTRSGLSIQLSPEELLDPGALKRRLTDYHAHPEYQELCAEALKLSQRYRKR